MRGAERQGHDISHPVVGHCLHKLHYSLQATENPTKEASIWIGMLSLNTSKKGWQFFTDGQPVISVDTKRGIVGNSRMRAANGDPKAHPKKSTYMIH